MLVVRTVFEYCEHGEAIKRGSEGINNLAEASNKMWKFSESGAEADTRRYFIALFTLPKAPPDKHAAFLALKQNPEL